MQLWNTDVSSFLKHADGSHTAGQIVEATGLTYSTVRRSLNLLEKHCLAKKEPGIGEYGRAVHFWSWIGG